MTTVLEIERAIEQLPSDQFSKIHDWIVEKDWQTWDAQIDRDSADGKLDFLVEEARRSVGQHCANQCESAGPPVAEG